MNRIILFSLFIGTFLFWYVVYPNHISNQEYLSFFELRASYFLFHCKFPGGISEWCGAFISQYYRWTLLGVLIQTLFTSLLYLAVVKNKIFDGVGKRVYAWGLLPVVFLFSLQMKYSFLAGNSLQVILWFTFFWGYSRIDKGIARWLIAIFSCYPAIMIFGALPSIIWLVCVVLFEIYKYSPWWRCVSIAFVGIACMIVWHYLYPLDSSYWITFFPQLHEFILPEIAWFLFLTPPIILVFMIALKYGTLKFLPKSLSWNYLIVTIILGGFIIHKKDKLYSPQFEQTLGLLGSAVQNDWKAILEEDQSLSRDNVASYVLTNLALSREGILAERVLDYPQIGVKGLIYNLKKDYEGILCRIWVYDWLGVKNEAYHWSVEASMTHLNNPPPFLVKQKASYLIDMGKEAVAMKFIKSLLYVPFYRDWARENLKRTTLVETQRKKDIAVPFKMKNIEVEDYAFDFFVGLYGPYYDLFELGKQYPENERVRDYLLTSLLLEKKVDGFYRWFKRYYPVGYSGYLPRLYREALITVGISKLDTEVNKKYKISNDELEKCKLYINHMSVFGNDMKTASSSLLKEHGNAFWYYMDFR